MHTQQHVIQQVNLNLNCSKAASVQQYQKLYEDAFHKEVLPALEELFDASCDDKQVIRIDQLNIDLGNVDENISPQEIANRMSLEIRKILEVMLTPGKRFDRVDLIPIARAKLDLIIHFLERGYLPSLAPPTDVQKEVMILLESDPDAFIAALRNAIRKNGMRFIERMSFQLPDRVLEKIFVKAIQKKDTDLIRLKTKLLRKITSNKIKQGQIIWQGIFKVLFEKETNLSNNESLGLFFKKAYQGFPDAFSSIESIIEKYPTSKIKTEKPKEIQEETEQKFNGIYGQNVGVILLHPFLRSFLDERKLLNENGHFKNNYCAERAVGLLHYLATGETETPEYNLSFQKILCGLPLNFPLQQTFLISEPDQKEAKKMMEAAIKHWDALGNISVEGLQEGFLQRTGKITQDETGLVLQVERKTIDILLDKIPWNTSLLKLPWLSKLCRVEWA